MKQEKKVAKNVVDEVEKRGKIVIVASGVVYTKMNNKINTIYGKKKGS